ncbi:hypothetical protein SAMN00777080_4412 [Aquiflexum balticum DSM 16537]|uniref:Uncharacterized protein n=2 Tax=Aquiflexum TaxID=280472 RepID=A0A1W2HA38_9BACT|nr:hypothetical protein SAMN00777080_4412 [Aquiflexum balticum DSM 16537]
MYSTIILIFFCSCCYPLKMNKGVSNILEKLYIDQRKLNPTIAKNLDYSRRMANNESDFNELFKSEFDTLWLIERVDEVDLSTFSFAWTSNRDDVLLFNVDHNGVIVNRERYSNFNDPLITVVEKFDTASISGKESPLGAKRVFISGISKQEVRTFYFTDITYPENIVE